MDGRDLAADLTRDDLYRAILREHARAALEVSARRDAPPDGGNLRELGAERRLQLAGRPHEVASLLALAVRVLRRVEAAALGAHLARHVGEDLAHRLRVTRLPRREMRVEVSRCEKRVVVEHLLEVRDEPPLVGGVAVKAPPDLVVDATGAHRVERLRHPSERALVAYRVMSAQEDVQAEAVGKLRARSEAAVRFVDARRKHARHLREEIGRHLRLPSRPGGHLRDHPGQLRRALLDLAPLVLVRIGDGRHHRRKGRHPVTRQRREIGPRVERLQIRRQKDGERPATAPPHDLYGRLVDLIEIRSLLPVHLHVHEEAIHERGGLFALEGLALHDVTPVAGAVTDGEENRPVLRARPRKRLLAPRIPVDGVVAVLREVGRALLREPIRTHLPTPSLASPAGSAHSRCLASSQCRRDIPRRPSLRLHQPRSPTRCERVGR